MSQDKALSVRQPWAWCIVQGYKPLENRSRKTKHRGPLLIHGSLKFDDEGYAWIKDMFPLLPLPAKEDFQRGGIVGAVMLHACVEKPFIEALKRDGRKKEWTNWFSGPYGWLLTDARTLPFKPCKGMLGIFTHKE